MSQSPSTPDPDDQDRVGGRPSERGRRTGKFVVPGAVVALILGLMVVLLSVTRCGASSDGVEGAGAGPVVVEVPAGP